MNGYVLALLILLGIIVAHSALGRLLLQAAGEQDISGRDWEMGVKKHRVSPLEIITPGVELDEKFKPLKARDLQPLRKFLAWYSSVAIIILGLIFRLAFCELLLRSPLIRFVGSARSFAFFIILFIIGSPVWLVSGNPTMAEFAWKALPWDIDVIKSMLGLLPFVLLPAHFCYRFIRGLDDTLPSGSKFYEFVDSLEKRMTALEKVYGCR